MFIALAPDGREVGTGRIDYRGQGMAEIHLTVAPECRGLGFAGAIIEALGCEAERLGWSHLLARVKPDNVASIRAFVGKGFLLDECQHFERKP